MFVNSVGERVWSTQVRIQWRDCHRKRFMPWTLYEGSILKVYYNRYSSRNGSLAISTTEIRLLLILSYLVLFTRWWLSTCEPSWWKQLFLLLQLLTWSLIIWNHSNHPDSLANQQLIGFKCFARAAMTMISLISQTWSSLSESKLQNGIKTLHPLKSNKSLVNKGAFFSHWLLSG